MKLLIDNGRRASERYATQLLHDEPNARAVLYDLAAGQTVPPHDSPSTVLVQVLAGSGTVRGESGEAPVAAGGTVVYAPGETHSMSAGDEGLRFLAVITPAPQ